MTEMIDLVCSKCGCTFQRELRYVERRKSIKVFCSNVCQFDLNALEEFAQKYGNTMIDLEYTWRDL